MNKNIARGLALAALTGGFSILGATAANAIDLPDLGGDDGAGSLIDLGGIVDDLHVPVIVDVPVVIDGLDISVLDNSTLVDNDTLGHGVLGDGIVADTGRSTVDVLAALGIDTRGLLGHSERLTTVVGVPVDLSNTWLSIFGNEYNGIVVVPNLSTQPTALITDGVDGLLDVFVTAPIDITCSSVTVLSDFENECTGGGTSGGGGGGGVLDGDLLGDGVLDGAIVDGNLLEGELIGDANGDGQITIEDRQLGVLDGGTLGGDPVLDDHGLLVEGTDFSTGGLDLTPTWVSVFGVNDGVVVVPDLTLDAEVLTKGLISHEVLAPIVIDCVTVTVLSDYERACAPGEPGTHEEPTTPGETPVVGGGTEDGDANGADNGGAGDSNGTPDLCAAVPASASIGTGSMDLSALAAAALGGGLLAMMLMMLGRRMGRQQ